MSTKVKIKVAIDIAMTILLMMQMGYHMMDNRAHEWTGVSLCVLFILHHVLNGGWYTSLFKGRYTPRRVLLTIIDVLLTLTMVVVICSAVLVSRHVFNFLGLQMRFLGRTIHMPATMWAFVLMGLHLGLHWSMFLGMMRRLDKGRSTKAIVIVVRIVLAAVFAFGAYQFIVRGLWMELFMKHPLGAPYISGVVPSGYLTRGHTDAASPSAGGHLSMVLLKHPAGADISLLTAGHRLAPLYVWHHSHSGVLLTPRRAG